MFRKILTGVVALGLIAAPNAVADSHQAISHLHDLRVFGDEILLGTHEGLYKYISKDSIKKLGKESPDVMGLSVLGKRIYASGHPAPGSNLPNPVGLLMSPDKGKSWQQISLQGKVDFHFLEVANNQIYGVNAGTGEILYSANLGKSWKNFGRNTFSDIAIDPLVKGKVLALRASKLYTSSDSLKSSKVLKSTIMFNLLDWNSQRLLATSGKNLLISMDDGKSWNKINAFTADIESISQSASLIVAIVGNEVLKYVDGGKKFTK